MRWNSVVALALGIAGVASAATAVTAQERGTVSGTVVEALSRRPVNGAQVSVLGTGLGTITGTNGRFVVPNVPAGQATVQVQIIGYRTVEQAVQVSGGATATVEFELAQTAISLDELVITGAGVATQKRKLGNTVATVNAQQLENAPVRNVSEMLAAREPGVTALASGGMAGEGARIRIRGSASLSQLNQPIVYIDGVRVDNSGDFAPGVSSGGGGRPSRLDDINPASIERIEILKGAAAATLYGTEASSGVIQIFTKKGTQAATRYEVSVEQAFSKYPENAYEPTAGFARTQTQADALSKHWGIQLQPFQVFEQTLIPYMYETGKSTTTSLNVSGGNSLLTYFVSGRFSNEDGPFDGNFWGPTRDLDEMRQATANLTIYPIDKLRVGLSTMYTDRYHETPDNNNNIYGTISSAIMAKPELANCNLSSRDTSSRIPGMCTGAGNAWGAPAFTTTRETMNRFTSDEVQHFAGSLNAGYDMMGVKLDATFGVDMVNQRGIRFFPFGWNTDSFSGANVTGFRLASDRNRDQITGDFKATHDGRMGEDWSFVSTVGAQGFFSTIKSSGGDGQQFPAGGVEVVTAGAVQTAFESFISTAQLGLFLQEQIGFKDYAFLTVGGRYDKHSAFGESSEGVWYPKVSLSVVPTDVFNWESNTLSSFRVRGAYGQSGRQPDAFAKFTTYLALAAESGAGLVPGNLGNPDLKPEVSNEWEVGTEIGLFSDRLALDATYWNRQVKDVLIERQFPPSGGFRRRQLDNVGEMQAKGLELSLRGVAFNSANVSVNVFATAAYLNEEITDLGGAPPLKSGGSYTRYRNFIRQGYAPGAFFGPKLIDNPIPIDSNADCRPDSRAELLSWLSTPRNPSAVPVLIQGGDTRAICAQPGQDILGHYLGKPTPDWSGTFGADVGLFGVVRVNGLFEYKAGEYYVHDLTDAFRRSNPSIGRNIRRSAEVESTMLNPASTPDQRADAAIKWAKELAALSPYDGLNEIHQADFIRLRELGVTYTLPSSLIEKIGARSATITAAGRNLALWTKYPGADPEMNAIGLGSAGSVDNNFLDGTAAFGVPIPRRYVLSTRITF